MGGNFLAQFKKYLWFEITGVCVNFPDSGSLNSRVFRFDWYQVTWIKVLAKTSNY